MPTSIATLDKDVMLGAFSILTSIPQYNLLRLIKAGKVPYRTVGRIRVFSTADIETARQAAIEAGYLPASA